MEKLLSSWSQNVKSLPESYIFPPETRPGSLSVPLCDTIICHRIRGGAACNNPIAANKAADNANADRLATIVWAIIACSSLVVFGFVMYAFLCSPPSPSPVAPFPSPASQSLASPSLQASPSLPASPSPSWHISWLGYDIAFAIACPFCTITAFYFILLSLDAPGRSFVTRIFAISAFHLVALAWVIMMITLHEPHKIVSNVTVAIVHSLDLGFCYIGLGAIALPAGDNGKERSFVIQFLLHIIAQRIVLDSSVWVVALYAALGVTLFCFSNLLDPKDTLQVVFATSVSFASAIIQVCVMILKLAFHGHLSHILNPYCIHIGIFAVADVLCLNLLYFKLKERPSTFLNFLHMLLPPASYNV